VSTPPANVHFVNTALPPGFAVRQINTIKTDGNSAEEVLSKLREQAGAFANANWIVNVSLTRESAANRSLTLWTGEGIAAELTPI
jgi:hypothetical protein